jgi:hypothetical protein
MFVLLIVKAVDGACITPEIEHNTLFSEPGATAALSKTFVKANVVVEPSGVIVLHLI